MDVAHAAVGVEDDDRDMVAVFEAFQRGLARVARCGHGDEVVVAGAACCALLVDACAKEDGQALQGHVLEGARGAVPQLEHVGAVLSHGHNRCNSRRVKVIGIDDVKELVYLLAGKVDAKELVDRGGLLLVGQFAQRRDLVERHGGDSLWDKETAAGRDSLDDGLGELKRVCDDAAGVDVANAHDGPFRGLMTCGRIRRK